MIEQPDGVADAPGKTSGGGESAGGAYPNPHEGQGKTTGGFMGHGGQTDIDYHGTGQGGADEDEDVGNVNAPTRGEPAGGDVEGR
jgi:hypothetical protein